MKTPIQFPKPQLLWTRFPNINRIVNCMHLLTVPNFTPTETSLVSILSPTTKGQALSTVLAIMVLSRMWHRNYGTALRTHDSLRLYFVRRRRRIEQLTWPRSDLIFNASETERSEPKVGCIWQCTISIDQRCEKTDELRSITVRRA